MPHGPERIAFSTHGFAVVVCRHPVTKKWLAVNESRRRGWWLPAGHVDQGQTFVEAAHAETREEAGIEVELTGLLAVEHGLQTATSARMRVVFFAVPKDPAALPKSVPDEESEGAAWMTVAELEVLATKRPPEGLRGGELLFWARYIEQGGPIGSIGMFQKEGEGPCRVLKDLASSSPPPPSSPSSLPSSSSSSPTDPALALLSATWQLDPSSPSLPIRAALMAGAPADSRWTSEWASALSEPHQCVPEPEKLWTCLHMAVVRQNIKAVRCLLLAGADANAKTHKGRAPLHMSVCRPCVMITRLLLLGGADTLVEDNEGVAWNGFSPLAEQTALVHAMRGKRRKSGKKKRGRKKK